MAIWTCKKQKGVQMDVPKEDVLLQAEDAAEDNFVNIFHSFYEHHLIHPKVTFTHMFFMPVLIPTKQ